MKNFDKQSVLIIAAHPDDEVLGCGGTIARLSQEGHDLYIAILGEGITSRYEKRNLADRQLIKSLRANCRQATDLLSVKEIFIYDLPDNRFDTLPLLDVVKVVEDLINRLQPQVVYTHHGGDLNIDHAITQRAVLTATRPVVGCPVKKIYEFEIPSSTEWSFNQFQSAFQPNVFVDITETLEMKIKAMAVYESEKRPFPHPRSFEAIRDNARRWGSMVGLNASEAFVLVRDVG
jgi:LmbE family N-acetylglucosaminyl deacetylase